jgi:hypothetical protein
MGQSTAGGERGGGDCVRTGENALERRFDVARVQRGRLHETETVFLGKFFGLFGRDCSEMTQVGLVAYEHDAARGKRRLRSWVNEHTGVCVTTDTMLASAWSLSSLSHRVTLT